MMRTGPISPAEIRRELQEEERRQNQAEAVAADYRSKMERQNPQGPHASSQEVPDDAFDEEDVFDPDEEIPF